MEPNGKLVMTSKRDIAWSSTVTYDIFYYQFHNITVYTWDESATQYVVYSSSIL